MIKELLLEAIAAVGSSQPLTIQGNKGQGAICSVKNRQLA